MKRKIAVIMAADVAGYSRLVAEDEEDALQRLLAYREIFDDFIGKAGGRVFNTAGDAVLAEFGSAVEALRASLDIQECIRTRNAPVADSRRMRFRIGMTVGDVMERDGDLLGDAVNVAARLEGLAEPGGICVSRALQEQVSNKVAITFRDIGMQRVKNIPNPIHAFTVFDAGAGPRKGRSFAPFRSARLRRFAAVPLTLIVVGVATVTWSSRRPAAIAPRTMTESTRSTSPAGPPASGEAGKIYGPLPQMPAREANAGEQPSFDAANIPFVCDACKASIAAAAAGSSNSAVAISLQGSSGAVSGRPSSGQAVQDALDICNGERVSGCQTYALNNVVIWPRRVPMPPVPWVRRSAARTPFDADRIGGLEQDQRDRIRSSYQLAPGPKALAIGPNGKWSSRSHAANDDEAMRRALETCGERADSPCRVVAVDNEFVVDPTPGPVDLVAMPNLLSQEPASGHLELGSAVLVDDGTCPSGQVKRVTGGSDRRGIARTRRCVAQ